MIIENGFPIIQKYDSRGDYLFGGQRGTQIGELNFYENGLILGTLADANDGERSGPSKLVLGVHSLEDGGFVLEKFTSLNRNLLPVYWSFKPETPGRQSSPANYQGIFALIRGLSLDNLQIGLVLERGIPEFDELIKLLNLDTVRNLGDKDYRESIETCGREAGQTGSLVLTAK